MESIPRDRRQLLEIQSRGLRRLLHDDLSGNGFYRRKYSAAGIDPVSIRGVEDLARLPFTTKEELQEDQASHPPYGSLLSFPPSRYVRLHQTSGTSGQPLHWLDTPESWGWILDCWERLFVAGGIEAADRFFIPFAYGPFLGFWGAFEGAIRAGHLTIAGGGMSSAVRLRWILDHAITVVACTPTYAIRLAEVAVEEGLDLPDSDVRCVIVAGEPGGSIPEVRRRIEEGWGARCLDHWGMSEIGPLGFEPLENPGGVHLFEDWAIAEIIDPASGEVLPGGGAGELVLTTFARSASPLIRYRTGDRVEATLPAPGEADLRTGQPFMRLEGGILGRSDEMVLIRGNNVYPGAVDAVLREFSEIREYRAEVRGPAGARRLHLSLEGAEMEDELGPETLQRIIHAVRARLQLRPEVEVVPAGTLPRFEFKARRFAVVE